ncbi:MAG: hypothetical protein WDW38_009199 [Sanguina aurantia]
MSPEAVDQCVHGMGPLAGRRSPLEAKDGTKGSTTSSRGASGSTSKSGKPTKGTVSSTGGVQGRGSRFYLNITGFPFPLGPWIERNTVRRQVEKDVWLFEQTQAIEAFDVYTPVRMTVIKLKSGGLWVHGPIAPTQVYLNPYQWSFPLNLPPQLLGIFPAGELKSDDPTVPWAGEIDQKLFLPPSIGVGDYVRFTETAFFHRRSRSLIVTTWVDEIVAEWDFQQIIPCHFDAPIKAGPAQFQRAFAASYKARAELEEMEDMQSQGTGSGGNGGGGGGSSRGGSSSSPQQRRGSMDAEAAGGGGFASGLALLGQLGTGLVESLKAAMDARRATPIPFPEADMQALNRINDGLTGTGLVKRYGDAPRVNGKGAGSRA